MYDYKFSDYIELYKNLNGEDWITLYEENTQRNWENDIFTFCALTDKEFIDNTQYLENFEWEFAPDSFGKAGFGTYGTYENGEVKEELYFFDGVTHDNFEYLIALRTFEKYDKCVEINPKFVWYGNLVRGKEGYYNPISDELVIKVSERKITVQREYLKDFLCAYQKVCVIVCDHRRWFNSSDDVREQYSNIKGKNVFLAYNISTCPDSSMGYGYCASIIGKTVIMPFKKPHHADYKYFTKESQYESFIVDYDEDEDETVYYTCNEKELANFFGANPEAPHFLTPVYFKIQVLDRYKNDSRNYTITDSTITFLSEWSIPFNVNKENIVSVWLGDLGRIPYEEQQYWKAYNIPPKGGMDQKFIDRQLRNKWTDASRIESKLVPTLNKLNAIISEKYGDVIFKVLSDADKEIYNSFMLPTNYSMPEYQSFLLKLCKLVSESINTSLIKKSMGEDFDENVKGSVLQLGMFLEYIGIDKERKISSSIKKVQDSRNKLAGHSASLKEYNKVWGREKDEKINSIADARNLLENIISSIEYVIATYEVGKE